MSVGNNFADLRITNVGTAGVSEDTVWPAFTDIMTVILMIFLMTLVTYLVRNTQLLDELQTTLIAKDQVSQQALLSSEQNTSLKQQLQQVRDHIIALQSTLSDVGQQKDSLQKTLEARELSVRNLETEIALLVKLRDQLSDSNSDLIGKLDLSNQTLLSTQDEMQVSKNTLNEKISLLLATKAGLLLSQEKTDTALSNSEAEKLAISQQVITLTEQLRIINDQLDEEAIKTSTLESKFESQATLMAGLSLNKEELEAKLKEMSAELSQLQASYQSRGNEVTALQQQAQNTSVQFKSLQSEYDSLDEEYRKLIRAARSPAGKYVVNVYYALQNTQAVYRLREPEQTTPTTYSLAGLEVKLLALKNKHKQALYTKVRIDDKSGIGFNEAWAFTQKILSKYDYYANDYADAEKTDRKSKEAAQ